jgi:glutamate dehydrogenase (NADP+)
MVPSSTPLRRLPKAVLTAAAAAARLAIFFFIFNNNLQLIQGHSSTATMATAVAASTTDAITQTNPQSCTNPVKKFDFLDDLRTKYPHQPIFLQAVEEMALSIEPLFSDPINGDFYKKAFLYLTEPERMISFHVPWMDDKGVQHVNRGWRVEFSSALGPYKGGLRFHKTVDDGILKFLGFEQIFKNSLTGLPLGGGKGGSDFDPKGKSEGEIRRFCESFMTELCRYIDAATDVPAGDIGVGSKEIGWMYGTYKRLANKHGEGVLTGKSPLFGGIHLRPEATGYGVIYMAQHAIEDKLKRSLANSLCAVSGSGNVAQYACKMLIQLGAKVVCVSDSEGVLLFEEGMTNVDLEKIIEAKVIKRARLSSLQTQVTGKYIPQHSPWTLPDLEVDFAFPCATQNEIDGRGARMLIQKGAMGIFEGANLPVTTEGQEVLRAHRAVLYIPGKAANAGGVGVSGLEMSQNASRTYWTRDKVDAMLKDMMAGIYQQMKDKAGEDGTLEEGCNRAGFLKVAHALKELGWVY